MRPQRNGFTLIELLVVVAIISLLVSILLPSLARAKDQARSAVCKSQMRQIHLAVIYYAEEDAKNSRDPSAAMGPAVASFKECAELYPNSPFAGQSLEKVIDFHLEARDYERCTELLETVFVDFPDASFLDTMLLKWGVALARMQDYAGAGGKLKQLLREYPNSSAAARAQKLLVIVNRKAGG